MHLDNYGSRRGRVPRSATEAETKSINALLSGWKPQQRVSLATDFGTGTVPAAQENHSGDYGQPGPAAASV